MDINPVVKGLGKFLIGASPASLLATGLFESKGLNTNEEEELKRLKDERSILNTSPSSLSSGGEGAFPGPFFSSLSDILAPLPFSQNRRGVYSTSSLASSLASSVSSPAVPPFRAGVPKARELTVPDNLKNFQYAPSSEPPRNSSLASLLEAFTTPRPARTGADLYRQAAPFMSYDLEKKIENLRKDYESDVRNIMEDPYLSARTRAAYLAAAQAKYNLGLRGSLAAAEHPSVVASRIAPGLREEESAIGLSSLPAWVKLLTSQQEDPYKLLRTLNLYQKVTGTSPLTDYQQRQFERQQGKDIQTAINTAVTSLVPDEKQGPLRNQLSIVTYNTLRHISDFNKLSPEQQQEAIKLAAQINHTLLTNQEASNLLPSLLAGGAGAVLGLGVGKAIAKKLATSPLIQKLVKLLPESLRGHGLLSRVFPAALTGLAGLLGFASVPDITPVLPEDVLNTGFHSDTTGLGLLGALLRGVPPGHAVVGDTGQLYNLSPSELQRLQANIKQLKDFTNKK